MKKRPEPLGMGFNEIFTPLLLMFSIIIILYVFQGSAYYNLPTQILYIPSLLLIFLLITPLYFIKKRRIPLSKIGFKMPDMKTFFLTVPLGIVLTTLFLMVYLNTIYTIPALYQYITPSYMEVAIDSFLSGDPMFWIFVVLFVLVAPIVEEFFFRGILYGRLRSSYGIITSVIFCSLLFSIVHSYLSVLNMYVFLFYFSIVMCLIFERTRSLVYPIIVHGFLNGFFLLKRIFWGWSYNVVEMNTVFFIILLALVPLFYVIMNNMKMDIDIEVSKDD